MAAATMRAVMLSDYCGARDDFKPGNLVIQEIPIPQPGDDQVQIKVSASSVNPVDWKIASGLLKDLPLDLAVPLGFDAAGVVTAVGPGVTRLKVGDEVWSDVIMRSPTGIKLGAYAEYVVTKESKVGLKPNNLSMQASAVIPLVGLTALQGVRFCGDESKTVLILGGSGGCGICAVQIAKAMGKKVYVTCSTRNVEFMKSLGADEIIDYNVSDWGELLRDTKVDAVFDTIGDKDAVDRSVGVLKDDGKFVTIASRIPEDPLPRGITGKFFLTDSENVPDLDFLKDLCEAEKMSLPVDSTFGLDAVSEAFLRSMTGKVVGKVSIQVS
jgi:NADPH:quinone reductase-like Zn-dependent oxidoreductase